MSYGFLDIAVTPSVRAVQARMGADQIWQDFKGHREFDRFTEDEAAFIAARDSFYMATVSETGWPYIQHRGGPKGFLKALDPKTLAFADLSGNKQYISAGNLTENDRVSLFLMDYPHQTRLKILCRARIIEPGADPALDEAMDDPGYDSPIERIYRIDLVAFDWNCPQHITPRFTLEEIEQVMATAAR
jgi:uncharacterized protein